MSPTLHAPSLPQCRLALLRSWASFPPPQPIALLPHPPLSPYASPARPPQLLCRPCDSILHQDKHVCYPAAARPKRPHRRCHPPLQDIRHASGLRRPEVVHVTRGFEVLHPNFIRLLLLTREPAEVVPAEC